MRKLIGRLVKVVMLSGYILSVVASVKATIAAKAQDPRETTSDA